MQYKRFGRLVRAVRRKQGWRQVDLALRCGVSQRTISRVECGEFDAISCRTVDRIAEALGIRADLVGSWEGARGDRLVDAAHAELVDAVVTLLVGLGWEVRVEYSFNHYGDRGRIDVLGWQPRCATLLIIEVKSEMGDEQEMLGRLDVKARVVPLAVRRELNWRPEAVGLVLVLPDGSGARDLVARHSATFGVALPARTREVRRWLATPDRDLRGILFLRNSRGEATKRRRDCR